MSLGYLAACALAIAWARAAGPHRCSRAVELARDHAPHLAELSHQLLLRVQASRRVDDHDVDALAAGLRDRLEGDRAGVRALAPHHHLAARALRPALQLLAGGRPERVS